MADDGELLRAWRAGDADAGRELVERHFEAVFRFFRNKAGEDVEDLVQATFASCLGARHPLRGEATFRTYLFTVARHELYALWRKRRRDAGTVDIGSLSVEDLAPSPGTVLVERDARARLALALRSLPLDLQVALELYYWEDMSAPELAAVLGIPEGTVRSRLRRGREQLSLALARLSTEGAAPAPSENDLDAWVVALKTTMSR